jgi:hypothetical protein
LNRCAVIDQDGRPTRAAALPKLDGPNRRRSITV